MTLKGENMSVPPSPPNARLCWSRQKLGQCKLTWLWRRYMLRQVRLLRLLRGKAVDSSLPRRGSELSWNVLRRSQRRARRKRENTPGWKMNLRCCKVRLMPQVLRGAMSWSKLMHRGDGWQRRPRLELTLKQGLRRQNRTFLTLWLWNLT